MKLSEAQQIFALNVSKLIAWIYEKGWACTIGEVYRTPEQALIYEAQGKGIKNSLHCSRLAVDLNLFVSGVYKVESDAYKELGGFWKTLNPLNRWGGDWKSKDANHFQMNYDTT